MERRFAFLLWDVDNTLLDFDRSEREALARSFRRFSLPFDETVLMRYSAINRALWEKLERGETTREAVLRGRFEQLFAALQNGFPQARIPAIQEDYQNNLADLWFALERAPLLLRRLRERGYRQYFVTNGVASTQRKKLSASGLMELAQGAFISEEIGAEKPDETFFRRSFAQIPDFDRSRALLIGDSPTSDMEGARRSGVAACWYDPRGRAFPGDESWRPAFTIRSLWELPGLLGEEAIADGKDGEPEK